MELLGDAGFAVDLAGDGQIALTMLAQMQQQHTLYDIVLMDMQMPVMDGLSAAREIRKNPHLANMPIIALTANVMVSEQNEILAAGMNDHIGKPIDPDHLVATLAKWVHPSRTAGKSAPQESVPQEVPASAAETLPNLPGVKVAASVRRIGGNVVLYYLLLEKFKTNQLQVVSQIREAMAANDAKTAERLAHTLRGIAGTLGAETLQSLAAQLENCFKNGSFGDVESLLAQVGQEVANLIAQINQAIAARPG